MYKSHQFGSHINFRVECLTFDTETVVETENERQKFKSRIKMYIYALFGTAKIGLW